MRVSAGLPTGMEGLTYPIPFSDPERVAEIALACGFTDHSAFSRVFKRATGLTPSEFRNREAAA